MALSLEAANLVRQKVYAALQGTDNPTAKQKLWWTTARAFFDQWVDQGNNTLEFIPYSEANADDDDGVSLADAACKVYLFYVNKRGTATTENTTKLFDNASGVDTTATQQTLGLSTAASGQEAMMIYPTGFSMANGVVITQHTTPEGTTDGDDGGDGFIVIGAA